MSTDNAKQISASAAVSEPAEVAQTSRRRTAAKPAASVDEAAAPKKRTRQRTADPEPGVKPATRTRRATKPSTARASEDELAPEAEDRVSAMAVTAAASAAEGRIVEDGVEVEFRRDGEDVVLTVGGKKRTLDEVDDNAFDHKEAARDEAEITKEEEGFSLSDADDADEPEQKVTVAGATADPVKDYLKQIGKVALLNAEEEVDLAKRIEAGLFAEEQLSNAESTIPEADRDDYEWILLDGQRAKNHLLEANLRLVVSLAKRYTGRGMLFLDLIQEGNLGLIKAVDKFDYHK